MRKKKDLPLVILKSLQPFVKLRGEKFEIVDPNDHLLKVIDHETDSTFHFIIEAYKRGNNSSYQFLMSRSPIDQNDNGVQRTWLEISRLPILFQSWVKLLDEYEGVDSFFDDPILSSFSAEYYSEFEIVNDDSKPLNTKQILLLDDHLERLGKQLDSYILDANKPELEDIKNDINSLRENLTLKPKKKIIKDLSKIWAKITKQGTKFMKELLSESRKEVVIQGVKGLIDFATDKGTDLLNL